MQGQERYNPPQKGDDDNQISTTITITPAITTKTNTITTPQNE